MGAKWGVYWTRICVFVGLPILAWVMTAEGQTPNPVSGIHYLPKPIQAEEMKFADYVEAHQKTEFKVPTWTPTGAQQNPVRRDCHPRKFEDRYLAFNGTEREKLELMRDYFANCGESLSRNQHKGFLSLLALEKAQYKIFDNPNIQPVRLSFANGESLTGYLGLKADGLSRPFVVIRCGLTCGAGESASTKAFTSHLFDQSPFNILVLASHTSEGNARDNHRLVFGGYYEAQEMHEVGKWIRFAAPFRHLVGSLHMAGISLGGHTALYSALYNDFNPINEDLKVFNSVIAYCPAINLQPTIHDLLTGGGLVGGFTRQEVWNIIRRSYQDIPDIQDLVDLNRDPTSPELIHIMGTAAARYLSRKPAGSGLFPFKDKPVTNIWDLWSVNQFINQSEGIETPTLVWSAEDDSVIDFALNGKAIMQKHPYPGKSRLMVLNTPNGNHCAHSTVYGWETTATVLRTFIQDHSFDFYIKRKKVEFSLILPDPSLPQDHLHMLQEWKALKDRDVFEIKYTIFDGEKNCKHPGNSSPACYYQKTMILRFADLPMTLDVPKTETEAEILTRWANANFEIHGNTGGRLIESKERPAKLVYVTNAVDQSPPFR